MSRRDQGRAMDWLLTWVMGQDGDMASHYWHANDGDDLTCGCPLQGEVTG